MHQNKVYTLASTLPPGPRESLENSKRWQAGPVQGKVHLRSCHALFPCQEKDPRLLIASIGQRRAVGRKTQTLKPKTLNPKALNPKALNP